MIGRAKRGRSRRAFTLVELLVVIAIIGVLVGLLFPAVSRVRDAARRVECQNNIRQLGIALLNYHSVQKRFPAGSLSTEGYAWGYTSHILPFIEEDTLFDTIEFDNTDCGVVIKRLQAQGNADPASAFISLLSCPSDSNAGRVLMSGPQGPNPSSADVGLVFPGSYLGVSGSVGSGAWCDMEEGVADGNGIFFTDSDVRLREIKDGSSHTLLLGERGIPRDLGWGWPICGGTECEHYVSTEHGIDRGGHYFTGSGVVPRFWSWHFGGAEFCFADGSVRLLENGMDDEVLSALSTRAGGEVVEGI